MCRALEVNPSGYYRRRSRKPSDVAQEDERLLAKMEAVHAESRGIYSSPKVYRKLRQDGEAVNHKRVARLKRENGINADRARKFKRTTDSRHCLPVAENVLGRKFSTARPDDEVWASDITYIWTG